MRLIALLLVFVIGAAIYVAGVINLNQHDTLEAPSERADLSRHKREQDSGTRSNSEEISQGATKEVVKRDPKKGAFDRQVPLQPLSPTQVKQLDAQLQSLSETVSKRVNHRQHDLGVSADEVERATSAELRATLEAWRLAWQRGDFAAYLQHYATNFEPSDVDYTKWLEHRRQRVTPDVEREIEIESLEMKCNIDDSFDERHCSVWFVQRFRSSTFNDETYKQLDWQMSNGRLRIVREIADVSR